MWESKLQFSQYFRFEKSTKVEKNSNLYEIENQGKTDMLFTGFIFHHV